MKRHLDNFEGAFPLLLIGSVLLVYAGILASQEVGSKSAHLPLWGLFGGVGAVIVGAGIYSTFLAPETPSLPSPKEAWVPIPKTISEPPGRGRPTVRRATPQAEEHPPWWEGAPETSTSAQPPLVPSTTQKPVGGAPSELGVPRGPTRTRVPTRPAPSLGGRYSLKELRDQLSELESIVYGAPVPAKKGTTGSKGPKAAGISTCMDCDRRFPEGTPAERCSGCDQGLCADCAASSRAEDGQVRCVECRARES